LLLPAPIAQPVPLAAAVAAAGAGGRRGGCGGREEAGGPLIALGLMYPKNVIYTDPAQPRRVKIDEY